ncbi:ABC transporter substrate-binding protein [Streptomyces sp. NPDC093094]|uniref:ABC transporter substrate-binding protein n=1 Tax=Streptomyces sp. NPDC093094 TaxID=3366026 RepID=UPI00381A01A3
MSRPPEDQQGGQRMWPDPSGVRNQKEFREALVQLREGRNLTQRDVATASTAEDSPMRLTTPTISTTLRMDELPRRDFTDSYLRACGLRGRELAPWLARWEELKAPPAPPHQQPPEAPAHQQPPEAPAHQQPPEAPAQQQPQPPRTAPPTHQQPPQPAPASVPPPHRPPSRSAGPAPRPPKGRRGLWAGVAAGAVIALAAGVGVWQLRQPDPDPEPDRSKPSTSPDPARHCGTLDPGLVTVDEECIGISDGRDDPAVFGDDLKPVMTAIGAENGSVSEAGDYVTFAFLTPLATGADSLTIGQYVAELEGAYTAVEEENKKDSRPKIRLVVANMGSSEKQWARTVTQLKRMKKEHNLVAVAGLGLSQQETVDATRALSDADLPMVGDLITADGFDATGAVDRKGRIEGLARIALSNADQLTAISKELDTRRRTAALVSTAVTPNGTRDLYTESLNRGFRTIDGLEKHFEKNSDFLFDPRGGPAAILPTISQNLCSTGKTIDTVYYAARVRYLPDFLKALARRSCHTQPITVVTGSDAAALDPKTPELHDADAPITVLYASFPSAAQLRSSDNPDRALYDAFVKAFTASHHGVQFPAGHLTSSYWPLVAHDAVLTLATALHNAAANGAGDTAGLPNRYAVRNELYALRNNAVAGAGGHFGIDKNGNRTNTATVTTVHRLGRPLDSGTEPLD